MKVAPEYYGNPFSDRWDRGPGEREEAEKTGTVAIHVFVLGVTHRDKAGLVARQRRSLGHNSLEIHPREIRAFVRSFFFRSRISPAVKIGPAHLALGIVQEHRGPIGENSSFSNSSNSSNNGSGGEARYLWLERDRSLPGTAPSTQRS